MCGRFTLKAGPEEIQGAFGTAPPPGYRPRYNIAPSQEVLAITAEEDGRRARYLRWGLVPFWARDPAIGNRMINARGETLADKPAYRNAFAHRRCLVLADGFYEWQRRPEGKRPMRVRYRGERPFALAGLWERWGTGAHPLETCTIVTTGPNALMEPIHDRMPVVLDGEGVEQWLRPDAPRDELLALLRPCPPDGLEVYEVSTLVNSPAHDLPECLDPVA